MTDQIKQPELVKPPHRNVFGPELKGYDASLAANKREPLRDVRFMSASGAPSMVWG